MTSISHIEVVAEAFMQRNWAEMLTEIFAPHLKQLEWGALGDNRPWFGTCIAIVSIATGIPTHSLESRS